MAHTVLPYNEWDRRMFDYAHGVHLGKKIPKCKKWLPVYAKIGACPMRSTTGGRQKQLNFTGSGQQLVGDGSCNCGYHTEEARARFPKTIEHSPQPPTSADVPQEPRTVNNTLRSNNQNLSWIPKGWRSRALQLFIEPNNPLPDGQKGGPLTVEDAQWLVSSKTNFPFASRPDKGRNSRVKLWYRPPYVGISAEKPVEASYHRKKLFFWAPMAMYKGIKLLSECCEKALEPAGIYNRLRDVLSTNQYFYLATERYKCSNCGKLRQAWDNFILDQLRTSYKDIRSQFNFQLSYNYTVDVDVIDQVRERHKGNSTTAAMTKLNHLHAKRWLRAESCYLAACERYLEDLKARGLGDSFKPDPITPFRPLPTPQWLMTCITNAVYLEMPWLKASMTSNGGTVLCMDSTKATPNKVQGDERGAGQWVTSVGNEKGEVLISVLTQSESLEDLKAMADGLISRYKTAGWKRPDVLYVDKNCCSRYYKELFAEWVADGMEVRCDSWHFMRRLATQVTTTAHKAYGLFMASLSRVLFEFDSKDLDLLIDVRHYEAVQKFPDTKRESILGNLTHKDLLEHCRRRIRKPEDITRDMDVLLRDLENAIDLQSRMKLFRDELDEHGKPTGRTAAWACWEREKKHLACLQDVEGVQLYYTVKEVTKSINTDGVTHDVTLRSYRCARGSTSLESFHLHLANFIPSYSANLLHFQAYLVDGIVRWNFRRHLEFIQGGGLSIPVFDQHDIMMANKLNMAIRGEELFPDCKKPLEYTKELIGAEYVKKQALGIDQFREMDKNMDEKTLQQLEQNCDLGNYSLVMDDFEQIPASRRIEHDPNIPLSFNLPWGALSSYKHPTGMEYVPRLPVPAQTQPLDLPLPSQEQSLNPAPIEQPELSQDVWNTSLTSLDFLAAADLPEDNPGVDQPTADDPGVDQPTANDPGVDQPTVDDPGVDQPTADDPGVDQPTADDPGVDQPTADDPGVDQPTADGPGVSQSTPDDPSLDPPSATDEAGVGNLGPVLVLAQYLEANSRSGALVQYNDLQIIEIKRMYEQLLPGDKHEIFQTEDESSFVIGAHQGQRNSRSPTKTKMQRTSSMKSAKPGSQRLRMTIFKQIMMETPGCNGNATSVIAVVVKSRYDRIRDMVANSNLPFVLCPVTKSQVSEWIIQRNTSAHKAQLKLNHPSLIRPMSMATCPAPKQLQPRSLPRKFPATAPSATATAPSATATPPSATAASAATAPSASATASSSAPAEPSNTASTPIAQRRSPRKRQAALSAVQSSSRSSSPTVSVASYTLSGEDSDSWSDKEGFSARKKKKLEYAAIGKKAAKATSPPARPRLRPSAPACSSSSRRASAKRNPKLNKDGTQHKSNMVCKKPGCTTPIDQHVFRNGYRLCSIGTSEEQLAWEKTQAEKNKQLQAKRLQTMLAKGIIKQIREPAKTEVLLKDKRKKIKKLQNNMAEINQKLEGKSTNKQRMRARLVVLDDEIARLMREIAELEAKGDATDHVQSSTDESDLDTVE